MKNTLTLVAAVTLLTSQAFADARLESDLGMMASYYRYEEPNFMQINAANVGMNYIGTLVFQNDWLLRGDVAGVLSTYAHYDSNRTGSADVPANWYVDIRALFGRNFGFENFMLTPYTGIGYRYLYNDLRGLSSTGAAGYRRESNYSYLPVGLEHKLDFSDQSRLVTNIEFDYLLAGKQISHLSDAGFLYSDVTNTQRSGYGARLSFMYQVKNLSMGPYVNYWHIKDSDTTSFIVLNRFIFTGKEPKNYTVEAGLKLSVLF